MKRLIITWLLALSVSGVSAQLNYLELSHKWDVQGNAIIEVTEYDGNIYSLVFEFYDLENFRVPKFVRKKVKGIGTLYTLKPTDPNKASKYRYNYRYVWGDVNPKRVDTAFVYRLPYALSESREPQELYNFTQRHLGVEGNSRNWKAFQFYMTQGDTVYTARRGEVIRVVDKFDPLTGVGQVTMNTERNVVMVQHKDGTIAEYGVLQRGSIMVKPSEVVYPGTPLGLAGSFDGELYQTRFSVYYQTDNVDDIEGFSDYKITYNYINPVFSTTSGEVTLQENKLYKPVCTEDMITREMTKKELKKRGQ
jgi:murein DD-endopeptidase MepM/ murein hydrolase activator NlpD